jgi:hypothetical protein
VRRNADATDQTTLDSYGSSKNARTKRLVDAASRTHTAVRSTRHTTTTICSDRRQWTREN